MGNGSAHSSVSNREICRENNNKKVEKNDHLRKKNNKNSETKKIEHRSFRADLREPQLKFLIGMLDLAKKKAMVLMDRKAKILKPEYIEIKDYIKNSNSFKFIENP